MTKQNKELFSEQFTSTAVDFSAGTLLVNKNTLNAFDSMIQQSRANSDIGVNSIANNLEEAGYQLSKPIVLDYKFKIVDGTTRAKAIIKLIKKGYISEIRLPYIQADALATDFNNTRGLTDDDLIFIFERRKSGGLSSGVTLRAVQQARESSQFLDVKELKTHKAMEPSKDQFHRAKIERHAEQFSEAFDGVLAVLDGDSPDTVKFSHWLALFARYGVSASTKNVAKRHIMTNKGSTQRDRVEAFLEMEREFTSKRAL